MANAALVKKLREQTGAGVAECAKALATTRGDLAKAYAHLKSRGLVTLAPELHDTSELPAVPSPLRPVVRPGVYPPPEIQVELTPASFPSDAHGAFVPKDRFEHEHPVTLAIYCSDGRFTNAVEELTRAHLSHDRLDTLTLPGGPALLTHGAADPAETSVVRKATSFLIRGHHIKELVLIAHEGCGFFKDRAPTLDAEQMKRRQVEELQSAARWLRVTHSGLLIRLYFADYEGDRIEFQPVPIDG